ncbi:DODA-type extradiol aromatic ring-opening family dioxygenase [Gluconobacter kanchanaburiensis]|uniref:Dioxygenase n=2 Tax=Gluconobacter kanchanaburiensis TaxID=563199 RepID=A0A511B8W8_9PROT|nr:aromatic ring-opening dioxygenase catalytic subunit LigB [Gluconobacter kanchanaburiensis NBRC 103587]GEK96895.1 dioxygenase [Gluconobacter kanchanaburiensis NBRC 103587]
MEWENIWDRMAAYLRSVGTGLPRRPDAIVVMSGHWETPGLVAGSAAKPSLIYDYYGFPAHTYQLQYPVPGNPSLAARVIALAAEAGIAGTEDAKRGLDHGVFIPFMLAFPEASIPVVEISLPQTMDATGVMRLGQALEPLRTENILIVGTGMSYHNMRFLMRPDRTSNERSVEFDRWLRDTVEAPSDLRSSRLLDWGNAPFARDCHPEPEHLLPLLFAAGAAGTDPGHCVYSDVVMGKALSGFRFG